MYVYILLASVYDSVADQSAFLKMSFCDLFGFVSLHNFTMAPPGKVSLLAKEHADKRPVNSAALIVSRCLLYFI